MMRRPASQASRILAVFAVGWAALGALAQQEPAPRPAADRLREGNALYRAGAFEEALLAYRPASPSEARDENAERDGAGDPSPAQDADTTALDVRLRLAGVTARLATVRAAGGPIDAEAAESLISGLREVLESVGPDTDARRIAQANLGSLLLEQAEAASQSDRPRGVELFDQAAAAYLAAYRLDRTDQDAARNVEHARRRAQQIRDDLAQNPPTPQERQNQQQRAQDQQGQSPDGQSGPGQGPSEAQEQQQQAQDLADQLEQLSQRQQEEAEQSAQGEQEQDAADQQQQLGREAQERLDELRQQRQARQDASQDELGPGAAADEDAAIDEQMERAQQALEEARAAQEEAEQSLREGRTPDAAAAQHRAADRLAEAGEAMREAAEQMQERVEQQQPGAQQGEQDQEAQSSEQAGQPGQEQPPEEAEAAGDPIVERLLERERRQRAMRAESRPGRPIRVERDW